MNSVKSSQKVPLKLGPLGGANLRCGHFSAKTYAKTEELDPVGGRAPAAPPGSANHYGLIN